MIRVLVADDQELVRAGFAALLALEPDLDVVGEAQDGVDAVALARRLRPDVVVMDVRMPRLDGVEATRRLLGHLPDTRVLMLTTFDLDEHVYGALRAGASGFLLKDVPRAQLVAGVRAVNAGEALLAPSLTRRLIEQYVARPPAGDVPASLVELSPRELEVLRAVARGSSNAEVAAELFVSEATVKTHVARVLSKLGLRDRVQAVVVAYEAGLVRPGEQGLPGGAAGRSRPSSGRRNG